MANEKIDQGSKDYKTARIRLDHTYLIWSKMYEDMLLAIDKLPTSLANDVVKKMLTIKSSLISIKHELDLLDDLNVNNKIGAK